MGSYYNYDDSHVQQPSEKQVHDEGQELNHLAQSYVDYYHEPSRKNAKRRQLYREGRTGYEVDEYDDGLGKGLGELFIIGLLVAATVLLLPSVLVTKSSKLLGNGNNCHQNSDCASELCLAGICLDKCVEENNCEDGKYCLADTNCQSDDSVCRRSNNGTTNNQPGFCGSCPRAQRLCKENAVCGSDEDCKSNTCDRNGKCIDDCAATGVCRTGQRCTLTEDCLNINDACLDFSRSEDFWDEIEDASNIYTDNFLTNTQIGPICVHCNNLITGVNKCRIGANCDNDSDCITRKCSRNADGGKCIKNDE